MVPGAGEVPATAAAVVLRRQRGLPLPGSVAGGAAVRPARRARGGLAAGGQRGPGVRAMAAAVAAGPPAEPGGPPGAAGPRRADGRHEFRVLPRGGPAAAVHGGRDRIPRYRAPGRRGSADGAQRRSARAHHGGRGHHHRDPHYRPAAGVHFCLRELRVVHVVYRPGPPDRERRRWEGRHRPAGGGHADRRGHRDAVGARRRAAGLPAPGSAAGRGRRRRVLFGDPLRDRPAGHGAATPGHVLAHAGAAAGVRHHHRRRRATPAPYRPGRRGHHPGSTRCRRPRSAGWSSRCR